jgi:predicted ArsR family transcriptional regulator
VPDFDVDARTHRALSGVSRLALLELLRTQQMPMDVPKIAAAVGLHPNTVRSHLARLLEVGLVSEAIEVRTRPGRPRMLYSAVPRETDPPESGPAPSVDSYQLLASILADGLAEGPTAGPPRGSERAGEAGRRWAERFVPSEDSTSVPIDRDVAIERVVAILDVVGFAPALSGDHAEIELRRCPFLDVAKEHSTVVCSVHRGLMQGALDRMNAPSIGILLEPFVRPGVCIAHVR